MRPVAAVLFACAAGLVWGRSGAGVRTPVTWDLQSLFAVPKSYSAAEYVPGGETNGVKAVFIEGVPFKGRETRDFAYWGVPSVAGGPVPAMVLVHGGGGTAFPDWVRFWNGRGYAAIAMDLNGCVDRRPEGASRGHLRHPWAGPGAAGCGGFDLMKERPEDQWMYHAVAAVVRAHSFLRAQKGVDPSRSGLTGVSWGGVVCCVVAAVDDRLRFAVPVYGCGSLYDAWSSWTHRYGGTEAKTTRLRKEGWSPLWDPLNYLPAAKIPVHWLNGTNDGNFSLPSLERSFEAVPTEKSLSLRVRMHHCHGKVSEQAPEVLAIADSVLRGAPSLPRVGVPSVADGVASVAFTADARLPVKAAALDYTLDNDSGWWYSNRWDSVSADIAHGKVSARIPAGTKWAYLSVRTETGAVVSSRLLDLTAVVNHNL